MSFFSEARSFGDTSLSLNEMNMDSSLLEDIQELQVSILEGENAIDKVIIEGIQLEVTGASAVESIKAFFKKCFDAAVAAMRSLGEVLKKLPEYFKKTVDPIKQTTIKNKADIIRINNIKLSVNGKYRFDTLPMTPPDKKVALKQVTTMNVKTAISYNIVINFDKELAKATKALNSAVSKTNIYAKAAKSGLQSSGEDKTSFKEEVLRQREIARKESENATYMIKASRELFNLAVRANSAAMRAGSRKEATPTNDMVPAN